MEGPAIGDGGPAFTRHAGDASTGTGRLGSRAFAVLQSEDWPGEVPVEAEPPFEFRASAIMDLRSVLQMKRVSSDRKGVEFAYRLELGAGMLFQAKAGAGGGVRDAGDFVSKGSSSISKISSPPGER